VIEAGGDFFEDAAPNVVLLIHGSPSAYSWRKDVAPLPKAGFGFHCGAPDQRGYDDDGWVADSLTWAPPSSAEPGCATRFGLVWPSDTRASAVGDGVGARWVGVVCEDKAGTCSTRLAAMIECAFARQNGITLRHPRETRGAGSAYARPGHRTADLAALDPTAKLYQRFNSPPGKRNEESDKNGLSAGADKNFLRGHITT